VNGYNSETAITSVSSVEHPAVSAEKAPDPDGSVDHQDQNDFVTDTQPTTTD